MSDVKIRVKVALSRAAAFLARKLARFAGLAVMEIKPPPIGHEYSQVEVPIPTGWSLKSVAVRPNGSSGYACRLGFSVNEGTMVALEHVNSRKHFIERTQELDSFL